VEILYNLPHVFHPNSNREENAYVLRLSLDYLISIDECFLFYRPRTPPLYQAGVVYRRDDTWLPISMLYLQKYGDCKSLAAARIAELHKAGIEARPVFRFVPRPDGWTDYHILVQVVPGSTPYASKDGFEDPSRILGMGDNEVAPFLNMQ
jgi:hypothetical protein